MPPWRNAYARRSERRGPRAREGSTPSGGTRGFQIEDVRLKIAVPDRIQAVAPFQSSLGNLQSRTRCVAHSVERGDVAPEEAVRARPT